MVIEFRFFNQIKKKKMKNLEYYTHATSDYIKFFFTLMSVDVETESENCNFRMVE